MENNVGKTVESTVQKIRHDWAINDAKRDAGLGTPAELCRFNAIPYGPNGAENTLEVYYPKTAVGALPTIVSVHGGAYVYGSTVQYQFYCMDLARRGFAVVNFNYRLAPESKFPAQLIDTNTVLQWVCGNREAYHFDTDNLFLVGDSAGAQLASQYAALYANPTYAKVLGIYPPDFRLAAVGLSCGMYDLAALAAAPQDRDDIFAGYLGTDLSFYGEKLEVLKYITAAYPPAYVLSAKGDFLLEHAQPMADLLAGRGVETVCRIYGDETTGHVFHLAIRTPLAGQANDDMTAFFRKHLR